MLQNMFKASLVSSYSTSWECKLTCLTVPDIDVNSAWPTCSWELKVPIPLKWLASSDDCNHDCKRKRDIRNDGKPHHSLVGCSKIKPEKADSDADFL